MKKYISLLLALIFVLSLCACGSTTSSEKASQHDPAKTELGSTEEKHDEQKSGYNIDWSYLAPETYAGERVAFSYEMATPRYLYDSFDSSFYFDAWALAFDDDASWAGLYLHTYFVPEDEASSLASELRFDSVEAPVSVEYVIFPKLNGVALTNKANTTKGGFAIPANESIDADFLNVANSYYAFNKGNDFSGAVENYETQRWLCLNFGELAYNDGQKTDLLNAIIDNQAFELDISSVDDYTDAIFTLCVSKSESTVIRDRYPIIATTPDWEIHSPGLFMDEGGHNYIFPAYAVQTNDKDVESYAISNFCINGKPYELHYGDDFWLSYQHLNGHEDEPKVLGNVFGELERRVFNDYYYPLNEDIESISFDMMDYDKTEVWCHIEIPYGVFLGSEA